MNTLNQLSSDIIYQRLTDAVYDKLTGLFSEQRSMPEGRHCLRVSTLPPVVMDNLCQRFATEFHLAEVVLLIGPHQTPQCPWEISATRLIELRNTTDERPLLVFVPPGLKAAAEDSFDVSTFVEVNLGNLPREIWQQIDVSLPNELRSLIHRIVKVLEDEDIIDDDDRMRYYLTVELNGAAPFALGGALYQLRLIPDFELFRRDDIATWLKRNIKILIILRESNQPLLGRIHELHLKENTMQVDLYRFLRTQTLDDVRVWGGRIATDPAHRYLSLDNWQFQGETEYGDRVKLYVDDPKLKPRDTTQSISDENPPYLDVQRQKTLSVVWETDPKPTIAVGLAYFRAEIISSDGAVVWESKNIAPGTSSRASRSSNLKIENFRERIDDGVYYVRVNAYNESGEIIHEDIPRDPHKPDGKRINETNDIWFWKDSAEPPPAEPQRNITVYSLLDAQLQARFAAMERGDDPFDRELVPRPERTGWASEKKSKRLESVYNIVYDAQTRFTLPVSSLLRQVESDTLHYPETLGCYRLNLVISQPYSATPDRRFVVANVSTEFMQARKALFDAILHTGEDQLVETIDILEFHELIVRYVRTYDDWIIGNHAALDIDTIEVLIPGEDKAPCRLLLIAPTHPLRLLWHLQLAQLAFTWIDEANALKIKLPVELKLYLRQKLVPVNLPPALLVDETYLIEQGPLTPFWSLYLPEDVIDTRAVRTTVQRLLGIGWQTANYGATGGIDQNALQTKFQLYLEQHPYITTLKINIFNPGDAAAIVDCILDVEKARPQGYFPSLRYEIRLFTRSSRLDDMGEAIDELLNPERQVSAEADAFSVRSKNHLFPKLRYSRNTVQDFLREPDRFEAHLTILYDFSPVKLTHEPISSGRSSFLHGLIQEQNTYFQDAANRQVEFAWQRQLLPSACQELDVDTENISAELATLLRHIALAQTVAHGAPENTIPTLAIWLDINDKSLLYQVHSASDWVIFVDRHLGLEFFDSDMGERPVYLLDYTPELGTTDSYRLLLTTRWVSEVTRLIHQALRHYEFNVTNDVETMYLQALRSLNGRLAFELLSSVHPGELLGMATARLVLEYNGALSDGIVLPLDLHSDLFFESRDESTLQHSDLLLITCDPVNRVLRFEIIRITWRASVGTANDFECLCNEIESQLKDTTQVLREHFDPTIDRIDRQVQVKTLISLLLFYLNRARRYRLVEDSTAQDLQAFIETLDEGYDLEQMNTGLIFDLDAHGLNEITTHESLHFYRVGRDIIEQAIEYGLRRRQGHHTLAHETSDPESSVDEVQTDRPASKLVDYPAEIETLARTGPALSTYNEVNTSVSSLSTLSAETPDDISENIRPDNPLAMATMLPESYLFPDIALPKPPILLGDSQNTPQHGVLGIAPGNKYVALDLNGTNTISLFGVQGGGKSYTLGTIVEMAVQAMPGINTLPAPLATVIFHYHESQDYPPEYVSMVEPNSSETDIRLLADLYGAVPARLQDILILAPADKIPIRQQEFPSIPIEPIAFASNELDIKSWRFLMGVGGNQMYMKQINLIMRQLRQQMTLDTLRQEIEISALNDPQKNIARNRLVFAEQFIDDSRRLADVLRPGRLVIVDLRDEYIDKDEALGLFVVMLNIFANAGRDFNKMIVFDEAHKYMGNELLTEYIVAAIRQMRHQGVSILIASQDPPSLPDEIIELSSLVIMHRFNSPKWIKHVQKSLVALHDLTPEKMAGLRPGEAYVWASKATERLFTQKSMKIQIRPRVTQHGGGTRKASEM